MKNPKPPRCPRCEEEAHRASVSHRRAQAAEGEAATLRWKTRHLLYDKAWLKGRVHSLELENARLTKLVAEQAEELGRLRG